ncbi:MAG TPA: hypothetical protein VFU46_14155 [Gemmatimonadales bacterium]|nr:hypothetical protein [Gemmatimonadales bacterium]
MAGGETGGRGAILYWIGWALLVIGVVTVAWLVFRPPGELGI